MNVAVAGLGFMGATHLRAWRQVPDATVVAVVSTNERKLTGDLRGAGGNLGSPDDADLQMDFSALAKYHSLEEALKDPAIDAVDLCLPTNLHTSASLASLRAGKHVLVEKPIALNEAAAADMIAEAERSGRILMAGHVLRFIPAYAALAAELQSSGPVLSALFRRRCAAPVWSGWLTDPAQSGGGIFDLLIHDADFCISLWGMPESVRATGHEDLSHGVDFVNAELFYPGFGPVLISGGWHHPESYPFSMEFTVVAREATLEWLNPERNLRVYHKTGKASTRELPDTDPFAEELRYFTRCVAEGIQPEFCPPAQSAQAVKLLHRIAASRKNGGQSLPCRD